MSASAFAHSFSAEVKICEAMLSQKKKGERRRRKNASSLQSVEPDVIGLSLDQISVRYSQPLCALVGSVVLFPQSRWKPAPFEGNDADKCIYNYDNSFPLKLTFAFIWSWHNPARWAGIIVCTHMENRRTWKPVLSRLPSPLVFSSLLLLLCLPLYWICATVVQSLKLCLTIRLL